MLKSCPFCGGEGRYRQTQCEAELACWVECCYCGASTNWFSSKEEAIKMWNMRYEPPFKGGVPAGKDRLNVD